MPLVAKIQFYIALKKTAQIFDLTTSYQVIIGIQDKLQKSLYGIRADTLDSPQTLLVTF